MQEKKVENPANKTPKKTNLLDHNSIKHILDESVTEVCDFLRIFMINFGDFNEIWEFSSFWFFLPDWMVWFEIDLDLTGFQLILVVDRDKQRVSWRCKDE